jgi:hypothetical protein
MDVVVVLLLLTMLVVVHLLAIQMMHMLLLSTLHAQLLLVVRVEWQRQCQRQWRLLLLELLLLFAVLLAAAGPYWDDHNCNHQCQGIHCCRDQEGCLQTSPVIHHCPQDRSHAVTTAGSCNCWTSTPQANIASGDSKDSKSKHQAHPDPDAAGRDAQS